MFNLLIFKEGVVIIATMGRPEKSEGIHVDIVFVLLLERGEIMQLLVTNFVKEDAVIEEITSSLSGQV